MKSQDRREAPRNPIRVLVRCLPPGTPRQRNGHDSKGWEMWACDIADDGVGLEWSRKWAVQRCPQCSVGLFFSKKEKRALCLCSPPDRSLRKGRQVRLDGLIYTEKGSRPVQGRIQWVRPNKKGEICQVGVHITSPNHRRFFKALEAA